MVDMKENELKNLALAIKFHEQGLIDQAKKLYIKILNHNTSNSDALHLLGLIAHQTGNNEKAIKLIQQAIKINPNISSYFCNLGVVYMEDKVFDTALHYIETALLLNPNNAEAHYNKGNRLSLLNQYKKAIIRIRTISIVKLLYSNF